MISGGAGKFWRFWLFGGSGQQVETAAVKVDRMHKIAFVPKATSRVLHPLDLGVDRLAGGVGDAVLEVVYSLFSHVPSICQYRKPLA